MTRIEVSVTYLSQSGCKKYEHCNLLATKSLIKLSDQLKPYANLTTALIKISDYLKPYANLTTALIKISDTCYAIKCHPD